MQSTNPNVQYSSAENRPPQQCIFFVAQSARKRLHSCVTLLIFISVPGNHLMASLYIAESASPLHCCVDPMKPIGDCGRISRPTNTNITDCGRDSE